MIVSPAKIKVRFADLDVLGHVNNSIYLSYFEMARVHYFAELLGAQWDWKKDGIILVKNEIEYHLPIVLHDEPEIEIFLMNLGNKSFTLGYRVEVKGKLHASGSSTLVGFNAETSTTIEIPAKMRDALEKLKTE